MIFTNDQLAEAIHKATPQLPNNHTNAIVGSVDATGAQVVIGFQKDTVSGSWQIQGAYRHAWAGDDSASVTVLYSW